MEYLYTLCGKKGKVVPVHATKAYWGSRSTAPLIHGLGTRWRWVVSFTTRPLYPWEVIPVLLSRRLVKPYSWSGCFGEENNLLPMPGFEPWLVQPLAQPLFQLRYPASYTLCGKNEKFLSVVKQLLWRYKSLYSSFCFGSAPCNRSPGHQTLHTVDDSAASFSSGAEF